jgi:hypothetical protein
MDLKLCISHREEHKFRTFVNRVLRKLFVPERVKVRRSWRKLHNEKLHRLYSLPNISRMIEIGHVECMGELRNAYKMLIRKSEGKRLHGRCRHRLDY